MRTFILVAAMAFTGTVLAGEEAVQKSPLQKSPVQKTAVQKGDGPVQKGPRQRVRSNCRVGLFGRIFGRRCG